MPKGPKTSRNHDFLGGEFRLPETELKVLDFWKTNAIFEKSLAKTARGKTFVFYEGPPSANGRPGIHHVISRVFKDIILRYKTMRGWSVPRKSGWDTHGLPIEIETEKQLGLKSKKDIEKFGIAPFNRKCREVVWQYQEEWERFTDRIGFWLDLKNPYITYENDYIETLWWVIKRFADKGLLYQGHKIVNWCPRCGTGLSSHELAQGYKEVEDTSVYMKFKLVKGQKIGNWTTDEKTYILSWTTTPWTLPGNVALAVGKDIEYQETENKKGERLWYASDSPLAKELGRVGRKTRGRNLVGLRYEPLFGVKELHDPKAYRIYDADFVTVTDGTGVVHTAVMYGEDDYKLGIALDLPQFHTVDEEGRFVKAVPGLAGLPVKDKATEEKIFAHLAKNNLLFRTEDYTHEYPHCWRCGTPLLYYARSAWFVAVNKVRKRLLANNQKINWVPAHLKKGRFGEWLKEEKDWNFSRERYWGTPLPVWKCNKCGEWEAIGSVAELSRRAGGGRNSYWMMRHAYPENRTFGIVDSGSGKYHLTPKGRQDAERSARRLAKELGRVRKKLDLVVSSPVLRTKETAEIAGKALGVKVVFDKRLAEINLGNLSGKPKEEYFKVLPTYEERMERGPLGGESIREVRARAWEALKALEVKYRGKNILFVSHEYPIWMLKHLAEGWDERRSIKEKEARGEEFLNVGEYEKLEYLVLPRNESGDADLHRPWSDKIELACGKCKGKMKRVKEVADVWFDSGSMPFAQSHYPFENEKLIDKKQFFPADYIAEAVDQTRGWFYTLLAVATLLGREAPYKNVISLGHINDKFGQKMSKSKGNVIDPWAMAEKHGMDAIRWYLFTATPPGEPKNFDENDVVKFYRQFHALVYNSYVFFRTYADQAAKLPAKPKNVLDRWILSRLAETEKEMSARLDRYEIREAGLALQSLADDLSRWHIRRSRRRFQRPESAKDLREASGVLREILTAIARLAAPFTPFFAEALWGSIMRSGKPEALSVHLANWPKAAKADKKFLQAMAEVREVASMGLAKRAEAGIKVRQPLASLKIKNTKMSVRGKKDLLAIAAEEVNVKKIIFDPKLKTDFELDMLITAELREEGILRELVRSVQELRQKAGCEPKDKVVLMLEFPEELLAIIRRNEKKLLSEVNAKSAEYAKSGKFTAELETKFEGLPAWFGLRKI
ncbi:MAG: Isoleucine-tRNA ligase [Parcubacteria group bacterium GW2011_GWA1_59_11]|nr:MAG: Isoleucine-tRNA ligase [Parcubacteria group bacterium GW2011_GWA1_59_11]